jgi:hypothetical protein
MARCRRRRSGLLRSDAGSLVGGREIAAAAGALVLVDRALVLGCGSGIRTGSGTSRGARLGSPTISCSLNFSMPSLSPSSGQASAARYWYSRKRRDRLEKLVAEPCTARTWWIVIEPALPRHGTARDRSMSQFSGVHRAAEPSVRAMMVVDRPLVAARHDHHRTVLHVVDLQAAINRYLSERDRKPKPFLWTADPDRIIEKVNRRYHAMASDHH